MESRLRALRRPLLYAFLIFLIVGSAGLLLSPAWLRESVMTLQFPVGIQANAIHFIAKNNPEVEVDRLKSLWPAHFDRSLYDQPDDDVPDQLSNSQMLVVLDFPSQGWWSSSSLHELKKRMQIVPSIAGEWYVAGMGQKLVFIPQKSEIRIWEPGQSYKAVLSEKVRVRSRKRWLSFEPFELQFSVPKCEVQISHSVEASEAAPLRYQVVFNFVSNYPLSAAKVRERAMFVRADLGGEATRNVAMEFDAPTASDRQIQVRSEFLDPLELNELLANLPNGDYMEGVVCESPAIVDRIPASAFAKTLTVENAMIELDRAEMSFWPEQILSVSFSQPVAQADVIQHLRLAGETEFVLKPYAGSVEFTREHLFTIQTENYDPAEVSLHFSPGSWAETGLDPAEAPRYDKKLQLLKPDSFCPSSMGVVFELKSEKQNLLACGSPESSPYVVSDLTIWKFHAKKDSPAIRLIGDAGEGDEGVSSSVVCYNKDKTRIYIAPLQGDEKFPDTTQAPFSGWTERSGYACDPLKLDCLAETISFADVCDSPVSAAQ